jgi:arginyl-tRNA synthetase
MQVDYQVGEALEGIVRAVAAEMPELGPGFDPMMRVADPRFGDFQANGVLGHAKARGLNPRQLGQQLLEAIEASGRLDPARVTISVAGPGFLNFSLSPSYLQAWLARFGSSGDLRKESAHLRAGQRVVVDYSSPNTAKEMHVGHIRSTVIGEALARLLEFAGAKVTRDNHLGDWGTQFGMLIHAIKTRGYDLQAAHANALADLEQLYKDGNAAYKSSPEIARSVRDELVKLQRGDIENTGIWETITRVSWEAFQGIYDRLGIHFDEVLGESFYRDKVPEVYGELEDLDLAEESEGALVVFHDEHPRFSRHSEKTQPFIIRKADGASNYATTDLATIRYRVEALKAEEILYCVDSRQSDHFEQLFLTARKWFAARGWPLPGLHHVSNGTILGPNGKPLKTKEGDNVKLRALLDEAHARALAIVAEKNPELPVEEQERVAEVVGIGAVRYADLSQNRSSDYQFSWEKMLALEGNTAPYLLYAVARVHSIFRKLGVAPGDDFASGAGEWETEQELALARKLVAFPSAFTQTLGDYRPHYLCTYLFELAGLFSSFYNADHVNVPEAPVRQRRLLLCARTLLILETGLHLLGLETLERM